MSRSRRKPARVRRSPDAARRAILEVAEKRLKEGGPDAVRVQHVAADLGITDAAVHHHFGSRQQLLEALLRFAGARLRDEFSGILERWNGDPTGVKRVAERIADTYSEQGYARLALWLTQAGWESTGSGMFAPLVDAVHRQRLAAARACGAPRPRRQVSQFEVALLNLALAGEPLMSREFLRGVGVEGGADDRAHFRRWLVRRLARMLTADEHPRAPRTRPSRDPVDRR